jgi:hypothetical protein
LIWRASSSAFRRRRHHLSASSAASYFIVTALRSGLDADTVIKLANIRSYLKSAGAKEFLAFCREEFRANEASLKRKRS